MSKQPAFWFYPGDWFKDTRTLSPAAKGAWIDLLCAMWDSQTRGILSLPLIGYARLIGGTVDQASSLVAELIDMHICDAESDGVPVTNSLDIMKCNGNVTLINRRMIRDKVLKESIRCRVKRFRNTALKRLCNKNVTSILSSSSIQKRKNKQKEKISIPSNLVDEIIQYLNQKAKTNFSTSTKATINLVKARVREGFTLDDFKKVIDNKTAQWLGNHEFEPYLRPETLFAAKHFESYLNEKMQGKHQPGIDQWEGKKYIVYEGLVLIDDKHILLSAKAVANRYGVDEVDCIFMNNGNKLVMKGIDKSKYKILRPQEDGVYDLARV
jgi:uncharacterized phage protein (TIGR02220 family)